MKLEFYNSATIRAPGALIGAGPDWSPVALKVRWAFLDHPTIGPTLVDTGYGPLTYPSPASARPSLNGGGLPTRSIGLRLYTSLFRAKLRPEGQIDAVLVDKGLALEDIQCVIVTHFHVDHVSELRRFSKARILASQRGLDAVRRAGWRAPLSHGTFTELLPPDLDQRLEPIEALPPISLPDGLGAGWSLVPELASLVPIDGHATGQVGIYIHSERYLYAVDAHFVLAALDRAAEGLGPGLTKPKVGLSGLPRRIADDINAAEATLTRLAAFKQSGGRVGLCHDPGHDPFDVG
jgi:glyoxylase-like metal-dependent hydrolase (beta-lactamase superfamily II)